MRRRPQLTYANVMVTVLAFVVLLGGGAYAAGKLSKNSVGTKQIKSNAVTSKKVKNGALKAADLAPGVLPGADGFQASGSINYPAFSSSLFGSEVVSLSVPPGNYFATASVEADNVNAVTDAVNCRLINGSGGGGSTATSRVQRVRGSDGSPETFTLASLFTVTEGQNLNLQCSKADPASGARVTAANIVAVQVGNVSGTTD